jgi:uncharacterized membrane protein
METLMGRLLQAGVLLASAVVLVGGGLYLHARRDAPVSYRKFQSEPAQLRHIHELIHGIAHADPASIIQLGILILIATPVARVVLAVAAFALEHDRLYVAVSLTVLGVLILGLFNIA